MAVATLTVHLKNGFFAQSGGYEFNLTLAGMALTLLLAGSAALSLDGAGRSHPRECAGYPSVGFRGQRRTGEHHDHRDRKEGAGYSLTLLSVGDGVTLLGTERERGGTGGTAGAPP